MTIPVRRPAGPRRLTFYADRPCRARDLALHIARFSKPAGPQAQCIQNNHRHKQQVRCSPMLALRTSEQVVSNCGDRQPAELATHSARVGTRHSRRVRAVSIEDDLSADVVPCDRADSHAKHGSAIMIMAWRSAPPRSCWKCKSEDQLEVERSTFSKIRDGSTVRNRLPHRTAVANLRCHSRLQRPAVPSRLTFYADAPRTSYHQQQRYDGPAAL